MAGQLFEIYTTQNNDIVYVEKGIKSEFDFIVRYKSPGKRVRTPKHIHLIVDLYAKTTGNEHLTMQLVDHIISLIGKMSPEVSFPPKLQFFSYEDALPFSELNRYGEYSVEFLLVLIELILRQEKTNYPNGTLSMNVFSAIHRKADIYSIVSAASFNGR